jgi:hypothetical protein
MATKKSDGEIFAKTLETIVAKIGAIETRVAAAETTNETTIKTVVAELKAIVERIEKLESVAAVPGLESELKAIVDRIKTEPAAAAVPTVPEPTAKAKPIFEKPTAEEASRRARKAWETRRARRGNGATGKTVDIGAVIAAAVREAMAAK